ncbi:MAG: AraC family transcriptional regulator [Bacillota bacterium]|nr:AraC family transcriptional regulator [Bacillota bacterium]
MYYKLKLSTVLNVTKIVTTFYFELPKNYIFKGESHNFWEILYVDSGEINARAGGSEYHLKQGDIIFHKPNEFHNVRSACDTAPNVFIITFDCKSRAMDYFKGHHFTLSDDAKNILALIMKECQETFSYNTQTGIYVLKNSTFGGMQMVKNLLEQFLIKMIRQDKTIQFYPESESFNNSLVQDITNYMKANIYNSIDINDICSYMHYGKTFLSKTFKKVTGDSLMNFYINLKIKEARKLIRQTDKSFVEISNALMFSDPHYFSRTFKRITGVSPKEYKNQLNKKVT